MTWIRKLNKASHLLFSKVSWQSNYHIKVSISSWISWDIIGHLFWIRRIIRQSRNLDINKEFLNQSHQKRVKLFLIRFDDVENSLKGILNKANVFFLHFDTNLFIICIFIKKSLIGIIRNINFFLTLKKLIFL